MPRILKAMLGLLAIATAGLNPAVALGGNLTRRNQRPEAIPTYPLWAVNESYLNNLILPLANTAAQPTGLVLPPQDSFVPKQPKKKYTAAEIARLNRLEQAIQALDGQRLEYIKRENAIHEYYLGPYTFMRLKQTLDEVDERSLRKEEIEFAQLMYCLHCEAYSELMKPEVKLEIGIDNNLPTLQRTWIQQYERWKMQDKILTEQKIHPESKFDPSKPINRLIINKIIAKFNASLSPKERETKYLRRKIERYNKHKMMEKNALKAPDYYFDPNVLVNMVRKIKELPFQNEFQDLFLIMLRMSDPELQAYFTDKAMVAAQFTALNIKCETDFLNDLYYFDAIMAFEWTQERLNVAVQNSELSLIELLMMMTDSPTAVREMYVYAITLRIMNAYASEYPHATVQENNARLSQFIKAIPGVSEETYRGCVMAFLKITQQTHVSWKEWSEYTATFTLGILTMITPVLSYWYCRRTVAVAQLQDQNVQNPMMIIPAEHWPMRPKAVKKDKPKQENPKNNDTDASSTGAPKREIMIVEDEATRKRRQIQENILEENTRLLKEQKQKEQELLAKKEAFIKLITVVHPYKRQDGHAAKIFENIVKQYKDSTDMEWFSKPDLSKFNEFKSQLKANFKESKNLGCNPDDNKILDALNSAYQASERDAKNAVHNNRLSTTHSDDILSVASAPSDRVGVFAEMISDDYLGPNYDADENEDEDEVRAPQPQASASSASVLTIKPVVSHYKEQGKIKEMLNVTPYLNAMHSETPSQVLRHAYKLLVIKFHEAWKHKLAGTPVGRYFAQLRNQLAHNAIAITDDLHIKLYAVLIKIESLQSDATSIQDWADAPGSLQQTLPICADRPTPLPQAEFKRLQQELIIIYQAAAACKDGYENYRLAFISIFADLGEVCSKQEMRSAATQLGQEVMNALKAMVDFRHKEYHSADLRALPDDVQKQYMVLLNNFVPQGVSLELGAKFSKNNSFSF